MTNKNLGGYDFPVNESEGGTNATTFDAGRTNMGLNALINAQTAMYTAVAGDRGKLIHYTGAGGVVLNLTAAATLLNGWQAWVRNDSAGNITITPNGIETIDGASTFVVPAGGSTLVICTGTTFYTAGLQSSGFVGANTALSNLASVAVNASLVPGADGSIDLGSAANRWRDALIEALQTGTTAAQTLLLQAYNTNTTSYTTFATLTANNPPTMALASAVTGATQIAGDNSTKLATTAYVDSSVGPAFNWGVVGVNTNIVKNHGYLTSSGGTLNMTLPSTAAIGDTFKISNLAGNFSIIQNLGQSVNFGNEVTTTTSGSITSSAVGDSIEIVCYNANAGFQVLSSIGNFTVV